MTFDRYILLCVLAVLSALLVIVAVKLARFAFRNETLAQGERRHHPIVRRVLNALPLAPVAILCLVAVKIGFDVRNQYVSPPVSAAQVAYAKAGSGDALAQRELGRMYVLGLAVTKDDIEAYFWYSLSSASGDSEATAVVAQIGKNLTDAQREAVAKRIAAWKPVPSAAN